MGPSGWTQIANFVITGLLMLVFSLGQRRLCTPLADVRPGRRVLRRRPALRRRLGVADAPRDPSARP
ncbi:hypothetical protein ACGFNP_44625 [Nonomuraea sp. NPDC049269]|uniref:hypothetical protein n=1 Tax=Nonomuraea sp. NPDC049269 TaxID=3364349 RepID=UPI003711B7E7